MTAFPADSLEGPDRCSPQGPPLHACLPGEQVENTAESRWNDLQNREIWTGHWPVFSQEGEDITEWPPTGTPEAATGCAQDE